MLRVIVIVLIIIGSVGATLLYQRETADEAIQIMVPAEEADAIRHLTYRQAVTSHDPLSQHSNSEALNLAELRDVFRRREYGGYCSNLAVFFQKTLDAFGAENYTLNLGIYEFSHVMNLVRIEYEGREILSLQDAYFDVVLVDSQGAPMDYFTALELLKQGRHDELHIQQTDIAPRPTICTNGCDNLQAEIDKFSCYTDTRGREICDIIYTWQDFMDIADLTPLYDLLARHGYPADWRYLFLVVHGVSGADREATDALWQRIQDADVIVSS